MHAKHFPVLLDTWKAQPLLWALGCAVLPACTGRWQSRVASRQKLHPCFVSHDAEPTRP